MWWLTLCDCNCRCVTGVQIHNEHDAQFSVTESEGLFQRPAENGLIHKEHKLQRRLGVPYVHVHTHTQQVSDYYVYYYYVYYYVCYTV